MNFTAIILAGGQSKRMGTNKALIAYQGKPLILYSIELALSFTPNILISANHNDLEHLGFPIIKDFLPVNAPLAGIHAGLQTSMTNWNLILTCDMPNVTVSLIDRLITRVNNHVQMVIPAHDGFVEPLCGFYHRDMISSIEQNIAQGRLSLMDLLRIAPHDLVQINGMTGENPACLFKNVNAKNDLLS